MKDQNRTKAQLVEELQRLREQSPEFERLKPLISGSSADAPHADRSDTLRAVRVPGQFREVFTKAEKYVKQYFTSTSANPEHGTIEISGERYILVRAASMSTEFFDLVTSLYEDRGKEEAQRVAKGFLFDIAHALGKADARQFQSRMKLTKPIERLSAGPVHFAYAGWAFVDIFPESHPSPDDNYFLIYDHPFAFEADAWLKHGRKTDFPVCIMNAGYSSGWCEESFGIPLVSVEVECRAMGDDHCRFVMASPSHIERHVSHYSKQPRAVSDRSTSPDIPEFFQRKRLEDALQKSYDELEKRVDERTAALKNANLQLETEIEERKSAEKALEAEKERLAVTLRSIGDGVIATDNQGKITLMNQISCDLTGWSVEEAIGKALDSVFCIMNEQTGHGLQTPFEEVIRSGMTMALPAQTVLVSRDGTQRIVADSGAPIRDRNGAIIGMVLVFRDITVKLKTEAELLKGQKLESLGILAGGIAHDFNNILQSILGNISLAKAHVDRSGQAFMLMDRAEKASVHAAGLTQQLLTFSKGGAPIKETASIAELVRDTVEFSLRGTSIGLQLSAPDDLWPVDVDRAQISQVMGNLIINAIQAMTTGGIVEVDARNVRVARSSALALKKGKYVKLSISDHGMGIPSEHLQKVFDPYFTTKETGSGLGLSVTYSIVKNHGGHITLESAIGKGTTVSVYLPASTKRVATKTLLADEMTTGRARILLMDDEGTVREAVKDILVELGYEATVAADGEEAVGEFTRAIQNGDPFNAVIMDLTVHGGMGGLEATRRLKEIDPAIRVLVTSGYATDPILANHQSYGFDGVLIKPFRIDQLADGLREVLRR